MLLFVVLVSFVEHLFIRLIHFTGAVDDAKRTTRYFHVATRNYLSGNAHVGILVVEKKEIIQNQRRIVKSVERIQPTSTIKLYSLLYLYVCVY